MSDNQPNQLPVTMYRQARDTGRQHQKKKQAVVAVRTNNVEYNGKTHVQVDSCKEKNKVGKDQTDHFSSLMFY